jgi:hypothetical protein
MTTYDQLVAIARGADLTAAVVELNGPFARRLDREMTLYRQIFGPWATFAGEQRHLKNVEELRRLFDADVRVLLRRFD